MEAEEFPGLGRSNASVGGDAVEMVEARTGRRSGKSGFALVGEAFLETVEVGAGVRIPRGYGTTGAGIATFQLHFTDGKTYDAAFVFTEQLIFPESGDAIDFKRGAKPAADVFQR